MRALIISTFLLMVFVGSTLVVGQTLVTHPPKSIPQSIIDLERALANADSSKTDRNSRLRLQRAEFYYQQALQYHQADWLAKAQDFARRGALLVALNEKDRGLPGFYRPHLASAQKTAAQQANNSTE